MVDVFVQLRADVHGRKVVRAKSPEIAPGSPASSSGDAPSLGAWAPRSPPHDGGSLVRNSGAQNAHVHGRKVVRAKSPEMAPGSLASSGGAPALGPRSPPQAAFVNNSGGAPNTPASPAVECRASSSRAAPAAPSPLPRMTCMTLVPRAPDAAEVVQQHLAAADRWLEALRGSGDGSQLTSVSVGAYSWAANVGPTRPVDIPRLGWRNPPWVPPRVHDAIREADCWLDWVDQLPGGDQSSEDDEFKPLASRWAAATARSSSSSSRSCSPARPSPPHLGYASTGDATATNPRNDDNDNTSSAGLPEPQARPAEATTCTPPRGLRATINRLFRWRRPTAPPPPPAQRRPFSNTINAPRPFANGTTSGAGHQAPLSPDFDLVLALERFYVG